jgi:plasmid stabilization system protein ParE
MRIVYLKSALAGLRWYRRYYKNVFAEGAVRANAQFVASQQSLQDNPLIGHKIGDGRLREYPIARTPFVLVYRLRGDEIQIVRIRDGRANPDES